MERLIIKGKVHTGPRAMGRALGENPFEVRSTPEPGRPSPDRGKSHRAATYHSPYHPVDASKLVSDFGDPGDHVLPAPVARYRDASSSRIGLPTHDGRVEFLEPLRDAVPRKR